MLGPLPHNGSKYLKGQLTGLGEYGVKCPKSEPDLEMLLMDLMCFIFTQWPRIKELLRTHSYKTLLGPLRSYKQQKVTTAEQEETIKLLKELNSWGLHFGREFILECFRDILVECRSDEEVNESYYKKFRRHYLELKTQLSEPKDVSQTDAERDPKRLDKFLVNLERLYNEYNITLNCLFNFDEKGFMLGIANHKHVVMFRRRWANLPQETDPVLSQRLVDTYTKLSDYFPKFDRSRYYSWATRADISSSCAVQFLNM
ncbi:hypothetical protein DFH08DRAFT_801576 [Mycena albidolilacea]|uniref:Uncharacterized protein n=1 Tax=Mycena albidolilacea TaxID=1033008 RepID=A0AAD7AIV4_9AGAR|nr:hypothetical protein DFH08DRAFT_801576 [Mycena albidolilacea]